MRLADIDLRLLRVFKTVAECGGIVKAQSSLGINQPTISSHIANLEERLNVRLCNRGPQGFSLTPEGQAVLHETDNLLSYLDGCSDRLIKLGKESGKSIRIGMVDCLVTDPSCQIHAAIRNTEDALGRLDIRLAISDYLDILAELRAGRFDLAIIGFGDILPDGISAHHLYDENSSLYCHVDHPCAKQPTIEELEHFLRRTRISAQSFVLRPIEGELYDLMFDESCNVSIGHIEATAHLVLSGTHIGLMPDHYASRWIHDGQMVRIAPEKYNVLSRVHLVGLEGRAVNAACELLRSELMSISAATS